MKKTIYVGYEKVTPGQFEEIEDTARFWNDDNLEMVKLSGEWYLLDGWNGCSYTECYKYKDRDGLKKADDPNMYDLTPAVVGESEPDEDGDYMSYETIGYEINPGYK